MSDKKICEKIIFNEKEISDAVKEMGRQISIDYEGEEVVFISVLSGAFIFVSDLVRNVSLDTYIDFMQISTYGSSTSTTGNFNIKKDISNDIADKHVIIVEDILDTGFTLHHLLEYLKSKNPRTLKIATFIDKPARRVNEIRPDYVGFTMEEDYFIVGYGLDYAQRYRNLPYVGVLSEHLQ